MSQLKLDELRSEAEAILARYEQKRAAMLPLLRLIQEHLGFIGSEAEEWVGKFLQVAPSHVHEVVTFYTLFHKQPVGKYHIQVCDGIACALRQGRQHLQELSQRLGIQPGQTTPDGRFTLSAVECLCACESAPVAQINDTYVGPLIPGLTERLCDTPESLPGLPVSYQGVIGLTEPVLARRFTVAQSSSIETYIRDEGYQAARKALTQMTPDQVIAQVSASNLRGLGGAGYPTGKKWSFIPKESTKPKFLVVNADEGEPGTIKDRYLITLDPHRLLEGMVIASFATGCRKAYIYIRGEYATPANILEKAVEEASRYGFLGKRIFNTDHGLEIVVHRGAGAYICGEETALLESLEGKKGFPRLKPPFPAIAGLFASPTVINNVETLSCVPSIIQRGGDWFAKLGFGKTGGTRLFSISGHVKKPGLYEASHGITLRELIEAAGVPEGRNLKAVIPGGISAKILRADEIDVRMDFDSLLAAGTMAGSAGVIVMDDTTCMVEALWYASKFFAHESCGQCSPCREGTGWIFKIVDRIYRGEGRPKDLDILLGISSNMEGRTICVFADAAAWPVQSYITKFREEFSAHVGKPGADPPRCSICWGGEFHVQQGKCDVTMEIRGQNSEIRGQRSEFI